MNNKHTLWRQGVFVDKPQYADWTHLDKTNAQWRESFLVRPDATDNAICQASSPEEAKWIAKRLNDAARAEHKLEAMTALMHNWWNSKMTEELMFEEASKILVS